MYYKINIIVRYSLNSEEMEWDVFKELRMESSLRIKTDTKREGYDKNHKWFYLGDKYGEKKGKA